MIFTFAGEDASRTGVGVGLGVRIVQEEPACRMLLGLRVALVMGLTAPGPKQEDLGLVLQVGEALS